MRDTRLGEQRVGYTKDMFIGDCRQEGFSEDVANAVWHYLADWQRGRHVFPIKLEDSLYHEFGIAEADLDDAVLEVAKQSKQPQLTTGDVAGMPVSTVRDLVAVVDRRT